MSNFQSQSSHGGDVDVASSSVSFSGAVNGVKEDGGFGGGFMKGFL